MEPQIIRSKDSATSSKALMLIAFVLAIAALYFGRPVLIPLALGLVLTFLLTPFASILEKLHIGRGPSVFVVVILSLGQLGGVSWVVARQLVEVVSQLPDYKYNLELKIRSLRTSKNGNLSKATATVQELNRELASASGQIAPGQSPEKAARRPIPVQVAPQQTNILEDLRALLGPLAGIMETAAIVIIFTIFMLLKREDLRNRAFRLAGRGQITVMTQALDDAGRRLSRYLLLQFLVNVGYGLLFGTSMYFIGIPHAFLWGVLAGLLRFVPYVGVLIAATLPVIMALAVFPGWRQAGLSFGVYIALEVIVANFVEPFLYGGNTGISSLAILVAAVFWTVLWGPVGLILSTPLTVCLIVLGRYVPQLNFLEIVLGDEPVLSSEQCFYQRLLAMDQDEARTLSERHLKEGSLEGLYDGIFLPALRLMEQDHQRGGLDDETREFVLAGIKEFIEDTGDRLAEHSENFADGLPEHAAAAAIHSAGQNIRVGCAPAKNGPDELVAMMLTQLLQQGGYEARTLNVAAIEEMLADAAARGCNVICVSSMASSSGAGQTRSLCRRLRRSSPGARVILGLWNVEGGAVAAREKLGQDCLYAAVTSLADAVKQIGQQPEMSSTAAGAVEQASLPQVVLEQPVLEQKS